MAFLDPVLNPVLAVGPFWAIFIISLVISLIIIVVYKFFTNQAEMKRLKEEQKEFQKRMKELRDKPEEMMKIQKEAMKKNFEYMKHSFKATFITILPIILLFGWMNAHLAFEPIFPGETYSMTAVFKEGITGEAELIADEGTELSSPATQPVANMVTWNLKSTAGEHSLTVKSGNTQQSKNVLVTNELKYEEPFSLYKHSDIEQININYNKMHPLGEVEFFGWRPGWLSLYIILSIVFSLGLRKIFKVY